MADELKLTTGESDLQLVSAQGGNIQIDKDSLEMNDLALSNATKYLATYNNPKDWVLDEKEAKMAQVLHSVEPEKSSILGTGAYAAGELLRTTYSAPREFAGAISAGKAILEDTFFPNAETSALERWADNYGKIEAQRERTSDELIAQEVGHPKIYNYGTAALQLIRDIALTGGVAKAGASVAAKGAARKVAGVPVSEDVAQRYATAMAKRGARRAGEATIGGSVFVQEMGSGLVNNINQYIDKTGDYDLKYYDPTVDLAVNIGVGALSAKIEKGLGVERFVPRMIVRGSGDKIPALTQILIGGVEGFIGEGGEEGAQTAIRQIGDMISGYRDWGDFDLDEIWTNMTVGGVLGAGAGSGLHYLNRRAAIRRLTDEGLDPKTAADLVDTIASREINKTLNDLSAVTELKTQSGQAYDKLKAGIKNALELQGWSEKMIDPQTNAELSIDEYSELVAKGMTDTAVREANKSGLPIDTFLDVASFANINNVLYLRPLGTPEQIQQRIDEQDVIIARQRELKKTGAGNETVLKEARMKRNILLNAYVQAKVRQEAQKVKLEQAQTEETKKEITTATQDAESLTKTESAADFNAELDNKTQDGQPITTGQKIKRFGNAVIKKIMGSDKTGFDSVMSLPEYTNARTAIVNSADRIFEFAKKHRTYGIYKDLRNALKKMQTVNTGNFIDSITTPSLDGVDVVAENAFLYHFIFSDAPTISAYIDAYLQRAEASITGGTQTSLSKKDLVGQAFKATDDLMQVQAESAGIEYTSIYDSTGALADKNVMAVLVSYQNQFVSDTAEDTNVQEPTAEEQKKAVEQAADVADGTITTGTPEPVVENVIQDYGEKIEGAKKDLVGKGVSAETLTDIDKIMKKAPKSETSKQILRNWLEQQDPAFVAQIRQLNLPIRVSKTLEYRRTLEEAFTQHPELNQEADRYSVLAGNEELSKETLDKYGIIPEYDFYYKTTDDYYVKLTPENVSARIEGRGALQFSYSKSTRGIYFLWAKKGSGSWIPLIEFGSMEEMDEHRNSHTQEEREKIYEEMTSFKDNRKEKVIRERVGTDYRNGKNVTEEQFAKQFGFRGVQFGNYENQEKRQREINNSYDSFMDLAKILNLPPKAISLGGTLGIAFGARGSGSALAHYEPDLKVINITRDAGAGALAHEWFHALDNYLAQNLSQYANMAGGGFLTKADNYYYYRVNEELADSMKEYLKAIKGERNFQLRLRQLGQYWKRDWEVAARLFEQYVSAKVAEQNGINDYLASPQKYYISSSPYLKLDEAERVFPKLENMLKSIKTREEDGNVILYQEQFDLADENARLDDIYPEYKGETIVVGGVERTVYNSEGRHIAKSAEALTNFWRWFGDSKVVDEQGRPLVVYHGSETANIIEFKGKNFFFSQFSDIAGSYGTSYDAEKGEGIEPNIYSVYLKIENPLNIRDLKTFKSVLDNINAEHTEAYKNLEKLINNQFDWNDLSYDLQSYYGSRESFENIMWTRLYLDNQQGIINYAKSNGFDGIMDLEQSNLGGWSYNGFIAFEPTQIKSVDNRGTYSEDTGNIYYQGRQANGFYDPELSVILLGKNWNTMTLPHELAHYWLDTLFSVYKRVSGGELKANAEWLQEKKDMFVMLGIDENQEKLTAGQQEKFARMVESYLTGIGVSKEMNQTFKEYFKWVPEKYKSILQLGYLDDQGKIQYPFLDQASVDFFNRWYENASLPSLPTSPERQRFMNATGDDGQTQRVSIKEMNDRQKEFGQDAEEQIRTDERLYNTLDENMSAETKPVADAQKVVIAERGNFLKESENQQRRWYERKSRDTEAQLAQDYIEKNPDHAKEVIFGDPELVPNDTGIDRATLINAYMALNNITPDKPEWATLHTNIAINQSLAGTQLALSNDKSYGTYLDALREVENALELKAATNYAGSKQGARERFNADIQRFLDRELPSVFATTPNSKERETALKMLFEKARTTFSGNTTGTFLNQIDLDYAMGQKGKTEAFMRWATNQIKKDAGAKLNNEQQAKLLQLSAKAQQALIDLDNPDADKAVAAAQELRKWQVEKDKLMGVSQRKFSLFGDWAPRAMLASVNTLVVANVPSTAINTAVTNLAKRGLTGGIFGEHNVSKNLVDKEVDRIKRIWWATGMNLAQMEKPTSPSLLHGEKYSASGQKIYDPYTILGWEDNYFRVPTFVNTLARIASTDAKATGRSADEVFREYVSLNNQSDAAKLARKQALAVANMAVFTQEGALASCLNHIRSELNRLSRVMLGLDPKGFGLGNLLAPFLTTGANIAEMGIRGSLAPITTITSLVNSWRTGKAIDPMKKLALRMDWAYFGLSAVAMVLLAALTSDDDEFYTDPYVTGKKYDPNKPYDSINIGGVWLDLDFFGPFAIPMRTAAKVIQAWEKDNGIGAVRAGYGASAKSVIGDIPLAESVINNQVSYAVKKPSNWGASYVYNQANKLVPAIVKPASRAVSRGFGLEYEGEWLGTTVGRKFHRNYGFDGLELTTQDLIEMLTTKVQLDESINKKI